MGYLFVYTKTYVACLANLTSQNVREAVRRTTVNITCSSLSLRSATCFGGSKTSKECPEANVRSFGSPAAEVLSTHETNQRQATIFHRTDAGAPSREAPRRRLVVRGQARRLPSTSLQGRQRCATYLAQHKPLNHPQLLDSLKLLAVEQVILDGEIVALDEKGRSSFQLLQDYKSSEQRVPLVYYVFGFLFVDGKDLRKEPLLARRKLLIDILKKAPSNIRLSEGLNGSKEDLLRVAQEFGLEGLVAKKPNSVYESGRRSGAWVKYKITKSQEFVIGGYTLPE